MCADEEFLSYVVPPRRNLKLTHGTPTFRVAAAAGPAAGLRRVHRGLGQHRRQRQLLHDVRAGHLRGDDAQPGVRAVPGGDVCQQLGVVPLP